MVPAVGGLDKLEPVVELAVVQALPSFASALFWSISSQVSLLLLWRRSIPSIETLPGPSVGITVL
jgi:hypothetical protein